MEKQVITIYAESTPNPAAMKFVANKMLVKGREVEFKSAEEAVHAPLVSRLFTFPFVKNVFVAANFISITKSEAIEWNDVVMELREFIRDRLTEGLAVVEESSKSPAGDAESVSLPGDPAIPQGELEERISGILEEYIRPAVEQDGGAIHFHSFKDGVVKVLLKGACSGCPSSTITLKAGIEGLMKRMVPEVTAVEAVSA
ncbi:MAG: NifU family protein [Flavobacteriales bacterium]|nr:NifU family protein [Flavobacteriales bacterium]